MVAFQEQILDVWSEINNSKPVRVSRRGESCRQEPSFVRRRKTMVGDESAARLIDKIIFLKANPRWVRGSVDLIMKPLIEQVTLGSESAWQCYAEATSELHGS